MYSPWAALACTLLVLLLVSTPPFRAADAPPGGGPREGALDGLRGLAAFGVFLHHAAITHGYLADGVWRLPPSRFFTMAGQAGVAVFFVITGYLFWGKLVRERGRPRWLALYVGRVFRIGPVYAVAILAMAAIVFVRGGGTLAEPAGAVARELARWMCLGILGGVPVDGDPATGVALAGVTWTLQYEWCFYAALPALALGALRRRWALPSALGFTLAAAAWRLAGGPTFLGPNDAVYAFLFAGGAVCASLREGGLTPRAPATLLSFGALGAVAAAFALFPSAYGLLPSALLIAGFLLVVSGGDLWGLLASRPARRLGDVSFGVYMMQGPVLFAAFRPEAVRAAAGASPIAHWAAVFAAGCALVALATLLHRWVEQPGIRAGRALAARLAPLPGRGGAAVPLGSRR